MERKPPIRLYKCCELILEDIAGGGVIEKSEFKTISTEMQEGALLSAGNDGIYHLTKTGKAWAAAASGATAIKVYKNNEFVTGNNLVNTAKTGTSRMITAINELDLSYDEITLEAPLNVAVNVGDVLIEVSAAGQTGAGVVLKYPPEGVAIAENPVNLLMGNVGSGIMVRGRVKEELMPYPVDDAIKAMLPLIRFV
jgi:hypothetical protein